jgi:ABC-type branched-subunit amino acid transport system ATPase component
MSANARRSSVPTSSADAHPRPAGFLVGEQITAGYGPTPTIREVTIQVGRGEIVAVLGPNGAGKSTLMKAITGKLRHVSGRVRLDGVDVSPPRNHRLAAKGLGYVPQVNDVFDTLTVVENLEVGGYLLSRAEVAKSIGRVTEIFPALAAMQDRLASKLSGGERKMLAIARALMVSPSVLLLDEPTANLAVELAEVVLRDHVSRLAASGVAVLLVEQRAQEALSVSDYGYIMVAGSVEIEAPAPELLSRQDIGEIFLGQTRSASISAQASG